MRKSKRLVKQAFEQAITPAQSVEIPAFLGDVDGVVKADDFGNVYAILFNGQVVTAKNSAVPPVPRLPVIIGYDVNDPALFVVLRARNSFLTPPFIDIPNHAEQNHGEFGIDPVFITDTQILTGLAYPIRGTMTVQFFGVLYHLNGFHILRNHIIDFTSYIPLSGAYWLMIEVDESRVVSYRAGTSKGSPALLTYEDIPALSATKKSLFAVRMYANQTEIVQTRTQKDIADLRFSGASSGGIASVVLWDDITDKPSGFPADQATIDRINGIGEGHTHASWRWFGDGVTTVFELPDIAKKIVSAYDHHLQVSPESVELAGSGSQIEFDEAPADGHIVTADYILERL